MVSFLFTAAALYFGYWSCVVAEEDRAEKRKHRRAE